MDCASGVEKLVGNGEVNVDCWVRIALVDNVGLVGDASVVESGARTGDNGSMGETSRVERGG